MFFKCSGHTPFDYFPTLESGSALLVKNPSLDHNKMETHQMDHIGSAFAAPFGG